MDAIRQTHFSDVPKESWLGELCFDVDVRGDRSRLTHLSHFGPLRIQRPFYPEEDGTAHVYLLHPPGGVAGGDHLRISANVRKAAAVLLTVPAATKIYRSLGMTSLIENRLSVEAGASLEWLPQETIVFDGALAELHSLVQLEGDARYLGWEVVCLGRPASGLELSEGSVTQTLEVFRDGVPLLVDRLVIPAQSGMREAGWGLSGANVVGAFAIADSRPELLDRARAALLRSRERWAESRRSLAGHRDDVTSGWLAVTQLEGALVARYLGSSVAECHEAFCEVWSELRPFILGKSAVPPRIWRV